MRVDNNKNQESNDYLEKVDWLKARDVNKIIFEKIIPINTNIPALVINNIWGACFYSQKKYHGDSQRDCLIWKCE